MLALSLPGQLETVGSIAGFAAILGLAVLSVLYFAQAREVKRLRDYLEDAGERAVGAPQPATAAGAVRKVAPAPVAGSPNVRVTPQPQAQPAAAAAAAVPAPAARGMAAPAGMGAPALASATRFGGLAAATAAAVATPEQREGAEAATQPPTKAPPEPAAPVAEPATQAVPALTPAAATPAAARAAGQGNGRSDGPVAPPPIRPPARPAARPAASRTMPPTRGARPAPAPAKAPPRRRRSWVTAALTVLALVLLAGIAFAAIQFISGSNDNNGPTASAPAKSSTTGTKRKQGASFSNGNTTVAVLNGTPTAGLAKRVADELVGAGFKQGTVTNASDQARSATIVSFLPGHGTEAKRVRSVLKAGSVQPMDPTTKAIACIAPNPCPSVVVTVGSDRAQ